MDLDSIRRSLNFCDFGEKRFSPHFTAGVTVSFVSVQLGITASSAKLQATGDMGLIKFISAIITRALFILIALIGVWRVTRVKEHDFYWLLTFLFLPLVLEMIITLRRRKGKDYKW